MFRRTFDWWSDSDEQRSYSKMGATNSSKMSAAQTNSSLSSMNASFNHVYTLFDKGKYEEAITFYDMVLAH